MNLEETSKLIKQATTTVKQQQKRIKRLEALLAAEQGLKGLDGWIFGTFGGLYGQRSSHSYTWRKTFGGPFPNGRQNQLWAEKDPKVHWKWGLYDGKADGSTSQHGVVGGGHADSALEAMESAEAAWTKYQKDGDSLSWALNSRSHHG